MSDKPEQSHWQTTSREEREQSRVSRAVTNVMDASRSAWNRTRVFAKGELDIARDLKDALSVKWAEMRAGMLPKRTSLEATAEARANYHRHVLQREPAPLVERTFGEPLTQWAARRDQPSSRGPSLEQIHERLTVAYLASRASVSPGPEYEEPMSQKRETLSGLMEETRRAIQDGDRRVDTSKIVGADTKLKEEIARADRSGDRTVDLARVPNPESGVAQAWASALREDGVHVKDAPRATAVETLEVREWRPGGAFATRLVLGKSDEGYHHQVHREPDHVDGVSWSKAHPSLAVAAMTGDMAQFNEAFGPPISKTDRVSEVGAEMHERRREALHAWQSEGRKETAPARVDMAVGEVRQQSFWKNNRREEARATAASQGRAPGSEMPVQGRQMRM